MIKGDPEKIEILNIGFALWNEGRLEEALEKFAESVSDELCRPTAHIAKGNIYWDKGLLDPAEQEFRNALAASPFSRKASFFLFCLLSERGHLEEAISEGKRFFEGRKSTREDELIRDYRQQLNGLQAFDKEEFEVLRKRLLQQDWRASDSQ